MNSRSRGRANANKQTHGDPNARPPLTSTTVYTAHKYPSTRSKQHKTETTVTDEFTLTRLVWRNSAPPRWLAGHTQDAASSEHRKYLPWHKTGDDRVNKDTTATSVWNKKLNNYKTSLTLISHSPCLCYSLYKVQSNLHVHVQCMYVVCTCVRVHVCILVCVQ